MPSPPKSSRQTHRDDSASNLLPKTEIKAMILGDGNLDRPSLVCADGRPHSALRCVFATGAGIS